MHRVPGLALVNDLPTMKQKMMAGALVGAWTRSDTPPLEPDKVGYYVAAFSSGTLTGKQRGLVARCVLWCDSEANCYNPAHLLAYRESALTFADDERSQFFVGALLYHKVIGPDSTFTERVYAQLLREEWRTSRYWGRYSMEKQTVLLDLAQLYCEEEGTISEDRVAVVERALLWCDEGDKGSKDVPAVSVTPRSSLQKSFSSYLSIAFRRQKRSDGPAEQVCRYVFNLQPDDEENNTYLASLLAERGDKGTDACAVYARLAVHREMAGEKEEANRWIVCLARAYIHLGRINEGTRAVLERASQVKPDALDLSTAHLYAAALAYQGTADSVFVALLEGALGREEELAPVFAEHNWEWAAVVRALAMAYGRLGRNDATAQTLYARAVEVCPEERELWTFHARSLTFARDYSKSALEVYERALGLHPTDAKIPPTRESAVAKRTDVAALLAGVVQNDDTLGMALAQAYLANNACEGERRSHALHLWEALYRQGRASPEMIGALVKAYTGEERANDVALSLWGLAVEEDLQDGDLRLRLAQEWRLRGEPEVALRYYKEAARLLPRSFAAQAECGILMKEHFSDFAGALRFLQKAVKLPEGNRDLDANVALGEVLLSLSKRDEARAVFQMIVDEIAPEHTRTLLNLANLSLKYEPEGVKQAEALYEKAQATEPELAETYRRMADLYHEKGQTDEEQEALEKYLELAEPDPVRWRQLADLYIRRGDFARAESALRRVIALGEGDKRLYTLLGEIILQQQDNGKSGDRNEVVVS